MSHPSDWPRSIHSRSCSEPLERRVLMATVEWIGPAIGNWNEPSNWSGGAVPGEADEVRIIGSKIEPFITLDSGMHVIKSISCDRATLHVTGGTLAIDEGGQFLPGSYLNMEGEQLTTNGELAVSSGATMNWSGGTLSGDGFVLIAGSPPGSGSGLVITGDLQKTLSSTIRNDGTAEWDGGSLTFTGGRFVNNGVFNASPGRIIGSGSSSSSAVFENNGTLNQIEPGVVEFSSTSMVNTGNVSASASLWFVGVAALTLNGGTIAGDLRFYGPGGALIWNSGAMVGPGETLIDGPPLSFIQGDGPKLLSRVLRHRSRGLFINADLTLKDGTIEFEQFGGYALQISDCAILDGGGTNLMRLGNGILQSGNVSLHVPLETSGIRNLGTLHLLGGGSASGNFFQLNELHVGGPGFAFNGSDPISGRIYFESGQNSLRSANLSELHVSDGATVRVLGNGSGVVRTGSLELATSAVFDLGRESMIIDYDTTSLLESIRGLLTSGYNAGAWNGSGINSSAAAASPGHALGYAEASAIFNSFPATFRGQQVDSTSVLVSFTRYGDANLDRFVDLRDFNRLAANVKVGSQWTQGNFNFDATTDMSDLELLIANFGSHPFIPVVAIP